LISRSHTFNAGKRFKRHNVVASAEVQHLNFRARALPLCGWARRAFGQTHYRHQVRRIGLRYEDEFRDTEAELAAMNSKKRLSAGKKIPVDADFYGWKLISILPTDITRVSAGFAISRAKPAVSSPRMLETFASWKSA
jgi:hypothetical protein